MFWRVPADSPFGTSANLILFRAVHSNVILQLTQGLNSTWQSKTLGFLAPSTLILAMTQEFKPLKSPTTPSDGKVSKSSKEESSTLKSSMPPPSSKTSTFEARTPLIQIKTEERSSPSQCRRKHHSSPRFSTRSSSSSWSQGMSKMSTMQSMQAPLRVLRVNAENAHRQTAHDASPSALPFI